MAWPYGHLRREARIVGALEKRLSYKASPKGVKKLFLRIAVIGGIIFLFAALIIGINALTRSSFRPNIVLPSFDVDDMNVLLTWTTTVSGTIRRSGAGDFEGPDLPEKLSPAWRSHRQFPGRARRPVRVL